MRFLMFNIAVGAALVYLLAGNAGDVIRETGVPERAVAAAGDAIDAVRRKVAAAVDEAPGDERAEKTESRLPEAAPWPPKLAPASTPKPAPSPTEKTVAAVSPEGDPAAEPPPAATYVAARPVHAAPRPGTAGSPGLAPPVDPSVARRRAEVLGGSAGPGRFAVSDGATLMSADERHRELSKLVDDMELLYINSLGN